MKKTLIFIILLFAFNNAKTQNILINRSATYLNYGQYLQILSLEHQMRYKGELDSLKEDYVFIATFNIDLLGQLINLSIENESQIPNIVQIYCKNILLSTSGKWLPEIQNCSPVISSKLKCEFGLFKKKTLEKKYKEQYSIETNTSRLLENFKITNIVDMKSKKNCYIFLSY